MKRGKKRTNWKARAESLSDDNQRLSEENAKLREAADAIQVFSAAVIENVREEIRAMVEEEVQNLEVHLG